MTDTWLLGNHLLSGFIKYLGPLGNRVKSAPLVVLLLVLFTGGYMAIDGARALATDSGDDEAGEQGSWRDGVVMRIVFVIWGLNWITLAALHVHRPNRWWIPLTIWSFASVWYLVVGTVFAIAIGAILVSPWGRPRANG